MKQSSPLHGKNFIGQSLSQMGTQKFRAYNPVTGNELPTEYFDATEEEIFEAGRLARNAFNSYRKTSGIERARFLRQIAVEILGLGDGLGHQITRETGFNEKRFVTERDRAIYQFHMFADLIESKHYLQISIDKKIEDRKPVPKPDLRRYNIPLGPVAVFGASNFPLVYSTPGGDVASALAAGCPVVVKAHPAHPGTSELVAEAVIKAAKKCGMPDGVFSMLHGISHAVSLMLVKNPCIKAVGFTGSQQGGLALQREADLRPVPIPVYSEMGSSNPIFVLPSALEKRGEEFAEKYFKSLTLGVGQFCTNPGLLIYPKGEYGEKLVQSLSRKITGYEGGCMLSPGLKKGYEDAFIKKAGQNNVILAAHSEKNFSYQCAVEAYLLRTNAESFLENSELGAEIFGPAALLVGCRDVSQMLEIADHLEGQLTATIWGDNSEYPDILKLRDILADKAGRLIFNGFSTGVEVCPSMVHGGPFPATTNARFSAVGADAIQRFLRPVCFQNFDDGLLPHPLRD